MSKCKNACGECCRKKWEIHVLPSDTTPRELTKKSKHWKTKIMMRKKQNGTCIAQTEQGCSIFNNRPKVCKDYFCN